MAKVFCDYKGCVKYFRGANARLALAMHKRRAHEGFNPSVKRSAPAPKHREISADPFEAFSGLTKTRSNGTPKESERFESLAKELKEIQAMLICYDGLSQEAQDFVRSKLDS